ncbi:hypothetical protein ACHWQZ_G003838 [Mnemiopsis leidyi]
MLSDGSKIGGQMSDYERLRLEKIRRNKALLDSLFPDLKESKAKLKSSLIPKRKERRKNLSAPYTVPSKVKGPVMVRRNPGRKARDSVTPSHCPPGATICQKSDSTALDDKYFQFEAKIRIRRSYTSEPVDIELGSDDETEEEREERIRMMQKPARHVMDKKYDRVHGTTCHQCRQKTLDGKTRCNNRNCVGVRGQFCGVCLLNRYGEDAETAIADKTWVCPPCKGQCNCSVCRSKKGKAPTGILTPAVRERGYGSVKEYLASLRDTEEEEPDIDLAVPELSPRPRDVSSRDPPSEMDYDDENKENIDPELSGQGDCKENVPLQMKGRVIVPLAPSIVLRDARRGLRNREVRGGLHGNQDKEWRGGLQGNQDNDAGVCNDRSNDEDANVNQDNRDNDIDDNDIDKIRRSTEQLNISDGDHSMDQNMASPSPRKSTKARPKKPSRIISRCLITWQSSRFAGGHQWVSPERIPGLQAGKVPALGAAVQVRWGKNKSNKLYPAVLSKVEYSMKRRRSCRF